MAFWKQTPRTFIAIMEGRARAAQRKREDDISLAWHAAAFRGQKRLKPLGSYLKALQPKRAQTADDVAAIFQSLKAKGKAVTIRERPR